MSMRICLILLLTALVVDVANCAEGAAPLTPEQRKELEGLTPEQRRARLREWREAQDRQGSSDRKNQGRNGLEEGGSDDRRARVRDYWERHRGVSAEEWEKRREELKGLSEEERKARIQKWRSEEAGHRDDPKKLTPAERVKKRDEMRARLERELAQLLAEKEKGGLSREEARRLQHLRELQKRFEPSRPVGAGKDPEEKRPRSTPNSPCASNRFEPCDAG